MLLITQNQEQELAVALSGLGKFTHFTYAQSTPEHSLLSQVGLYLQIHDCLLAVVVAEGAQGLTFCIRTRTFCPKAVILWIASDPGFAPQAERLAVNLLLTEKKNTLEIVKVAKQLLENAAFQQPGKARERCGTAQTPRARV